MTVWTARAEDELDRDLWAPALFPLLGLTLSLALMHMVGLGSAVWLVLGE